MWLQKNENELLKTNILFSLRTVFPDAFEVQSVVLKRQSVFSHKRCGICRFSRTADVGVVTQKVWLKQLNNRFDNYREMNLFLSSLPKELGNFFPEYYFYLKEGNILGMQYIEGALLSNYLIKVSMGMRLSCELSEIFFKLGGFLRTFQTHSQKEKRKFSFYIEETQRALKISELLTKNCVAKILNHLYELNKSLGYRDIVITKLLNDFSLRNILVDRDSELKIVDTESLFNPLFPAYGPEWLDLANFLLNLKNFSFFLHSPKVTTLRQYFNQGYAGDCSDEDKVFIRACIYVFTVQLLVGMVERHLEQRYSGLRHRFFIQNIKQSVVENIDLGLL